VTDGSVKAFVSKQTIRMAAAALLTLWGTGPVLAQTTPPDIPFAPNFDPSIKDPDNPTKVFRLDFARVDEEFPLSRTDRMTITPENLAVASQEQLDQIYARSSAGLLPDGAYLSNLFFPPGENLGSRLGEIVGGMKGRLADASVEALEAVGRRLWKGKVFSREQRVAWNMVENLIALRDQIDDVSTVPTTVIPRSGLLGRILPEDRVWLLFPAKVYCGQSLVDSRRESLILDYNYADEIDGYRARPDALAGRSGLRIRDEIRMVRPGLYLGRAYANRMFLLNFTLYNPDVAEAEAARFAAGATIADDCWPGEQVRKATVR
jgi:hypothetical protein